MYVFTASFPFQQPTPSTFQVWRSGQVYKYNWKWWNIFMKLDNIYVVACCLRSQRDILWCTGEVAVGDIVMTMVQICSNWAARWQAAVTWLDVQYTVNTMAIILSPDIRYVFVNRRHQRNYLKKINIDLILVL